MKPFSPLYFIKQNKARCAVLIGMIFLSFAVYLAGLYIMNVGTSFEDFGTEFYKSAVFLQLKARDEASMEGYEAAKEAVSEKDGVRLLELGWNNSVTVESIMGFTVGYQQVTFLSIEDFKMFCRLSGVECDFTKLGSKSVIMSERLAKNLGVTVGDVLTPEEYSGLLEPFTLDAVTGQSTYTAYYISEGAQVGNHLILNEELGSEEFADYLEQLQEQYPVKIHGKDEDLAEIDRTFSFLPRIYILVLILVAVIMAVTVNAVFVGVYQGRSFEFAVYRAIGMGKRKITGKIIGELLWMEGIALAAGGIIFFLGLYLLNNLCLYPKGKYLEYYNGVALFGFVLCNVIILIPLMITRCRQMHKADICAY
ncbi:MAG: hypothetical protein PUC30_02315 [Lachnospiraceae bacterium]|nr:hypothetical protein [Lachnospiraceae bacterium]